MRNKDKEFKELDEFIYKGKNEYNFNQENSEYNLIIGIQPYMQKIGHNDIRVDISNNNLHYYKNFDTVAFLVRNWLKIQDSLEMVFNLLTRDNIKTLKLLSFLREQNITPIKFTEYLLRRHNTILVNKYDVHKKNKKKEIINIVKQINKKGKKVNILFIGNKQFYKGLEGDKNIINEMGYVYHPSGKVLNRYPIEYERIWYNFDNTFVKNKSNNPTVKLDSFGILS